MKSFDRLLTLPLFLGMTHNDIEAIVDHTPLGFSKCGKGKIIIEDGEPCDHLRFLLQGECIATSTADDGSYSIGEVIKSPEVIQPECLFGLHQRYTKTLTSTSECSIVSIKKNDVTRLMSEFDIFRLNILNIMSTRTQRLSRHSWRKLPETIRQKIFRFIETRCSKPAGHKMLRIKMEVLADQIGESRINVSRCLNELEKQGILTHSRAIMDIPALERLME
ncbi:MAG: Crp/Fnr family transcriptional regulator [Prevotella sp.]|nr:Crp/Fnr family transcriptional regulator [Prevotella sp.]